MGPVVFVLSPANTGGRQAERLLTDRSTSEIAAALHGSTGAPLGDVFSFMSPLYFRGKRAYAEAFANPPLGADGVLVIVPGHGLLDVNTRITIADLRAIACVDVRESEPRYRTPFARDVALLNDTLAESDRVVFLGSVATDKYLSILTEGLGNRLYVPAEFTGLGSMSRGALLLKCVEEASPLTYVNVLRESLPTPPEGLAR